MSKPRKTKQKDEQRPITAQPVGDGYLANPSPSRGGTPTTSQRWSEASWGFGCYRRMPTNKE